MARKRKAKWIMIPIDPTAKRSPTIRIKRIEPYTSYWEKLANQEGQ